MFPSVGAAWLGELPSVLADVGERWSLVYDDGLPDLSINLVLFARQGDGVEVVVKACPPNPERPTEIAALQECRGRSCVRLLEVDETLGVLLLERLRPGRPLTDWIPNRDNEATEVAASAMAGFWRPAVAPHPYPTLARWADGMSRLRSRYDGGTGPFPTPLVEATESLFRQLLNDRDPMVLHGDLHHGNILSSRDSWVIIDPKGVVGDPAYDAATFVASLGAGSERLALTDGMILHRASILSDRVGIDRERILAWALARTVLSAWWCIEDDAGCAEEALVRADQIARLLRRGRSGRLPTPSI